MPSTDSDGHIGVYLVDDHPAIRDAIRTRIDGVIDMEVCGGTSSQDEAAHQIKELAPKVAVIDISLGDGDGLHLIEGLPEDLDVQSVVYSMCDEEIYAERALRAGAAGYLMKEDSTSDLKTAIRTVSEGNTYLSKEMTSQVLWRAAEDGDAGPGFPIDELTDREMSVFRMLGDGYSIEEIKDQLGLAKKTIETYRRRAKEKLGLDTISELLQFAVKWNYGGHSSGDEKPDGPPVRAES